MNYAERKERLIARARRIGDRAAVAILEADREYRPGPDDRPVGPWQGLRWRTGAMEAAWWPKGSAA